MHAMPRLSVLDQSPIHDGGPAHEAPRCSVRLAQAADALGYHRYWVAEHHDTAGYAGSCPEVLIGHIAQATRRIRVGSGGVMLMHYSPYKVAETFRMLEALNPGRIDLGLGRAPGAAGLASAALAWPYRSRGGDLYGNQVHDLSGFLHGNLPADHDFAGLTAQPDPGSVPELWLLGSGDGSAEFAGRMGTGFALALFIGTHERSPAILEAYRRAFRPSPSRARPATALAVAVLCAPTAEEARHIAATHTWWKVQAFRHNRRVPLLPPEECLRLRQTLSPADRDYWDETLATMIVGDPAQCREALARLAADYAAEEIIAVNVCYRFEDRLRSYRLLAHACGLPGALQPPAEHAA